MSERLGARVRRMVRNLGARGAAEYVFWKLTAARRRRKLVRLRPASVPYGLYARIDSSDLDVFGMVFSGREYGPLADQTDVRFVLDGGGNVGYSAAWFLATFPDAVVCSVEPDPANVDVLRRNLAPYGERALVIHAALWSCATELEIAGGYRDGRDWSRQVRPLTGAPRGARTTVPAITIEDAMRTAGVERISILKLDVEGAEAELFRASSAWIQAVDAIVVELHDDAGFGDATAAFHDAIAQEGMDEVRSGELVIARRRHASRSRT